MRLSTLALLLAAACCSLPVQAAPTTAQTDDVREAIFRTLLVRAHALMPDAQVYILEKDGPHPPEWGNISDFDPSPHLLQRFVGSVPRVVPVSQSGGGASDAEDWHEDRAHQHGPLLQIVSLHWLNDAGVEAETFTDAGLPHPAVSIPYRVDF